jgi:hypothetical protein
MRETRGLILFILAIVVVAAGSFPVAAQKINAVREGEPEFQLPDEVKLFVEAGTKAIAYAKSDLNGDGTLDYIVVLEKLREPEEEVYADTSARPTLIIVRDKDEKLSLAARSERVVFCATCAGGMGDAFDDITIERGGFSITNRGGNRERWIEIYEFKYSRRDDNWLLARVVDMNYDSTNPNPVYKKTYTSPKHFGKINFADFDPENFKGKGKRAASPKKSASGQQKRGGQRQNLKTVNVFLRINRKPEAEKYPDKLFPVKRRVEANAPLHNALEAWTEGATRREKKSGLASSHFGLEYNCVTLEPDGTAIIRFTKPDEVKLPYDEIYGGDIVPPLFIKAAEQTAMQFPGVKKVVVCLDGNSISAEGKFIDSCPGSRVN